MIPVTDPDRSKAFYAGLGWRLDADFSFNNRFRVVQFTPPGSGASIQFGTAITTAPAGSAQGLYLIVSDIQAARDDVAGLGVEVSEVFHPAAPGAHFAQDGNGRRGSRARARELRLLRDVPRSRRQEGLLQEVTVRLPGRVNAADTRFASTAELANAMRRASVAHAEHEQRQGGEFDVNWPDWYAAYMVAEQAGTQLPT